MNKFNMGGQRNKGTEFGGRPKSDANYGSKRSFDKKPRYDNRDSGGFGASRLDSKPKRDVELFEATCTTCGKGCSVPFRPDGQKPVLCKECFAKKNASPEATFGKNTRPNFERRDSIGTDFAKPQRHDSVEKKNLDISGLQRQMSSLDAKLNDVVQMIKNLEGKIALISSSKDSVKKTVSKEAEPIEKKVKKSKEIKPKKTVKEK